MVNILAFVSILLLSLSGLPQTIKLLKTRSCTDVSLTSLCAIFTGLSANLSYMMLSDIFALPLLINNLTGMVITLCNIIIVLILRHKGK